MRVDFDSYRVEIVGEPFSIGDKETPKTAVVIFLDENKKEVKQERFGYLSNKAIYGLLRSQEPVNIDGCYLDNFSLTDFRKEQGMEDRAYVEIKSFSCQNAFIDGKGDIDFSFSKFSDDNLSFSNTMFGNKPANFYKAQFSEGNTDFSNVVFTNGNVDFQFVEIGKGNLSFHHAEFGEGTKSFVNTMFGDGKINFKEVLWGKGKVDFHYGNFGDGDISFEKSVFKSGAIDFRRVEFGQGKADFRRVNFGDGEVSFEEAEFKGGKTNFRSAVFGAGNISFEMVDFGTGAVSFDRVNFGSGSISFVKAKASTLSFKECHLNDFVDLRVRRCGTIDLTDTIVRDIIDLQPISTKVELDNLILTGVRNLGRIFIDWERNKVYDLISTQEKSSTMEKAYQFLILKEDFHGSGKYDDEDSAYVEFKRFELTASMEGIEEEAFQIRMVRKATYFLKWLIFDKAGLYATNPIRVLKSMLTVFTAYSLIYTFLPYLVDSTISCPGEDGSFLVTLGNAFYYSAITFLTVGYGDCLPTGIFKWLAPMEGWMGVFLMSYFTVAFVRKILR